MRRLILLLNYTIRVIAGGVALSIFSCQAPPSSATETIIFNGTVYTLDDRNPVAEAVAIRDGRIIAVGSLADVTDQVSPNAERIDLEGGFLLPGLIDSHNHAIKGGDRLLTADVGDELLKPGDLMDFVNRAINNGTAIRGDAVYVTGMHSSQWSSIASLDSMFNRQTFANQPVMLIGTDGHTGWCNREALRRAGINQKTIEALESGERQYFGTAPDGAPNGFLKESAIKKVAASLPPSPVTRFDAAKAGVRHLNSLGITAWLDPSAGAIEDGVENPFLIAYDSLARSEGITAHVIATVVANANTPAGPQIDVLRQLQSRYGSHIGTIGFKIFADGVLEFPTQTAAVSIPYTNSGATGSLMVDPDRFKDFLTIADSAGLVVHTHAIGDRAVTVALDAIESARSRNKNRSLPHTITHLQVVVPSDLPRFAKLNVMASMQLLWATAEHYTVDLVKPYLDPTLYAQQYPARSLVNAGAVLCGASDWPVTSANPFEAIAMAETRKGDLGVLNESEAVNRDEMIKAYTIHAAKSMLLDDLCGSIVAGKRADFVLVDRDVLHVSADVVRETKVLWTMFGGNTVFRSDKQDLISP